MILSKENKMPIYSILQRMNVYSSYSESNVEIYRTPVQLQGWCWSLLPYLAPNWSVPHMVTIFLFLTVSCANSHYIRHPRGYPNSHTVIICISLFLGIWIVTNDPLPFIIFTISIYIPYSHHWSKVNTYLLLVWKMKHRNSFILGFRVG